MKKRRGFSLIILASVAVVHGCGPRKDAPVATPIEVPMSPFEAQLAHLPAYAPFYFAVNPKRIPEVFSSLPGGFVDPADLAREVERETGLNPMWDLAGMLGREHGIDASRPIVGAGMWADEKVARVAMRAFAAHVKSGRELTPGTISPLFATEPPMVSYGRVLVPILGSGSVARVGRLIARMFPAFDELNLCEGRERCAGFDGAVLARLGVEAVFVDEPSVVFLSRVEDMIVVELVRDIFLMPALEGFVRGLSAGRGTRGGPRLHATGCAVLNPTSPLSLCVYPAQAASSAAVEGWSMGIRALSPADPASRGELVDVLVRVADLPKRFASSGTRMLRDMGASVEVERGRIHVRLVWEAEDPPLTGIESVIGDGVVVRTPAELASRLLLPLRSVLGDPGADYHGIDARSLAHTINEGGAYMYAILLAQRWPNVLASPLGETWTGRLAEMEVPREVTIAEMRWSVEGTALVADVTMRAPVTKGGGGFLR